MKIKHLFLLTLCPKTSLYESRAKEMLSIFLLKPLQGIKTSSANKICVTEQVSQGEEIGLNACLER